MSFVVKIACGSDIRRQRFSASSDVNFAEICAFVKETFHLNDCTLKYTDDEGDMCILNALTLADALELASAKKLLRVDATGTKQEAVPEQHPASFTAPSAQKAADNEHLPGVDISGATSSHDFAVLHAVAEDVDACSDHASSREHSAPFGFKGPYWCKGICKGKGKGKGKFNSWAFDGRAENTCGWSGPRRLLFAVKMLWQSHGLGAEGLSEMLFQGLPMLAHCAVRKAHQLTKMGPLVIDQIKPAVVALASSIECVPELQHLASRIYAVAADSTASDVGMLVVEVLQNLAAVDDATQRKVLSDLASALLPCLDDVIDSWECRWHANGGETVACADDASSHEDTAPFGLKGPYWEKGFCKGKGNGKGKGKYKGKFSNWASNGGAENACGWGGPRRTIFVLKMLQQAEGLTAEGLAELLIQWLPMIAHRAARKMHKLTKMGPHVIDKIKPAVVALASSFECVPELQHLASRVFAVAEDSTASDVGSLVVEVLNVLTRVDEAAQRKVLSDFASALLPCLEDVIDSWGCWWHPKPQAAVHLGVACDGCQASPLKGTRFKCKVCSNYDLCSECHMNRDQLHHEAHDFAEISSACDYDTEQTRKGKGKGFKGWKGQKGCWF